MHDGYIFTLAICGSAAASSPAPALTNAMLAALPPVKRAAMLGELLPLDSSGRPYDPLLGQVATDMRDAEILLFVTPIYHPARLPARLAALLKQTEPLAAGGNLRGKLAALVGVDAAGGMPGSAANSAVDRIVYKQTLFAPLQRFCLTAGIEIVGAALVAASESPEEKLDAGAAVSLAQRSYARARERLPHALPKTQ